MMNNKDKDRRSFDCMSTEEATNRLRQIFTQYSVPLNTDYSLAKRAVNKAIHDMHELELFKSLGSYDTLHNLIQLSQYFNIVEIQKLVHENQQYNKLGSPESIKELLREINNILSSKVIAVAVTYGNKKNESEVQENSQKENCTCTSEHECEHQCKHECECKSESTSTSECESKVESKSESESESKPDSDDLDTRLRLHTQKEMLSLDNWKEVTKGLYRYVIGSNTCYEIHIVCYPDNTNIMKATANVYIVGHWTHVRENISQFTRETLAGGQTVEECIKVACNDYNENVN